MFNFIRENRSLAEIKSTIRNASRRLASLCIGLLIMLSKPTLHAHTPYKAPPRGSLCETLIASTPFEETEVFRTQLRDILNAYKRTLDKSIRKLTDQFFEEIRQRTAEPLVTNRREDEVFLQAMGVSLSNDSQRTPPPAIAKRTLQLLERAFYYNRGWKGHLWDEAFEATKNDPYFKWLQTNKRDNRYKKMDLSSIPLRGGNYSFEELPLDPTELLKTTVAISGASVLSPKLSIIRVYRDLDPELPPGLRQMAHNILLLAKASHELYRLSYNFKDDPRSPEVIDALRMAPNIQTAIENLNQLFSEHIRNHGNTFPRASYEKLLEMSDADHPDIKFRKLLGLAALKERRGLLEKDLQGFELELNNLRRILQLPPNFNFFPVLYAMDDCPTIFYAGYEFALGHAYEPLTSSLIWGFANYVRFASMLIDPNFATLLGNLVSRRQNYRY